MLADKQEKLFKQWLGKHKNLIFKVVKAYTASPQDQEELFQETLLHLWSSIPNFDGQAKETTWIYKVALYTALVWKRDQKRRRKRYSSPMIDFDEISDVQQSSSDSIQAGRVIDQMYAAIRELPKIDSSIILMYLDGISYREMAEILGISTSNVGVRLNRAKKQLAGLLKGLIDDV